jgi:hypothetical protein
MFPTFGGSVVVILPGLLAADDVTILKVNAVIKTGLVGG